MSLGFDIGSVAAGFIFGLALAVPPGPMNAIIAEESVTRGWRAGAFAGAGAMLADVVFFLVALAGVAAILDVLTVIEAPLLLVGGLLMLVFAAGAGKAALATTEYTDQSVDRRTTGFQKALILGLTNPFQLAFWVTVGVALVRPGTIDIGDHTDLIGSLVVQTGSLGLLGGFFAAIVVWITLYPAALVALGDRVDAAAPVIAAGSALLLGAFGAGFVYLGVTGLV